MNTLSAGFNETTPLNLISDSAISESAIIVRQQLTNAVAVRIAKMVDDVSEAGRKHSKDDWDGEGAKRVDRESYDNAIKFALTLPISLPIPEISVDPDGTIAFEWYEDKRRVFSVSAGSKGELFYAGLFGQNRTHGVETLTDLVPEVITNNISRVYSGVKNIVSCQ